MSIPDRPMSSELSRWHHSFPPLGVTPTEFYGSVQAEIDRQRFPGVETGIVEFRESGLLSAKRAYLRALRGELIFDLCGAPFGTDTFFVSCRLGTLDPARAALVGLGCLAMVPLVGMLAEHHLTRAATCYERDTALLFQEAMLGIVMARLDDLCGAGRLVPLTEVERKPTLNRLLDP